MKPVICLFFSLVFLMFLSSCGCKDKDYEYRSLHPSLVSHFGMYKTGSYWVYENQDKTKRDSIYVTSYLKDFNKDHINCRYDEFFKFTLKSNSKFSIKSDSVCFESTSIKTLRTSYHCGSYLFDDFGGVFFHDDNTVSSPTHKVAKLNTIILNAQEYSSNILGFSNEYSIYTKENMGIIGWESEKDTFNLIKIHLLP
jgi:hypothetical protein